MARVANIIGEITDYQGRKWDVRERRPTAHGFDVYLGWPHGVPRGKGGSGGPQVILTAELAEYLSAAENIRCKDIDLPFGKTRINKLRAELGISWRKARAEWWASKKDELQTLTLAEFAQKYGVSEAVISLRLKAMAIAKPRHTERALLESEEEENSNLISTTEAAQIIASRLGSYSAVGVRKMCQWGKIPDALKVGKTWLIPREWAETYQPRQKHNK
ncbi:hypothetical protein [Pyramidobacter sp.]|uniref:hypothetical protein n=1 Tax=Pyramidobacter sp. TaxID=1943581 RepID=UPI0025CB79F1|nr:hypothetical protein [Pyramidobacter sp.]MCI7403625.1 hypothetical protein [Pyramidobacter sp.]MDY3213440.1 hypothetical protein [Pyramidobacter sp.]